MATVFSVPFASTGDKTEIPTAIQSNGRVSFEEGFGKDYEKALLSSSDAKNIEREKLNYLFNLFCVKMNTLGVSIDDLVTKMDALTLPIGIPFPYPLATPPTNHLKCNGGAFDTAVYTKLATMYTDGKTPDLRAGFIRGWDDGKGIDTNRVLLSIQDSENKSHTHQDIFCNYAGNPGGIPGNSSAFCKTYYIGNNSYYTRPENGWTGSAGGLTHSNTGGTESRPRNIAFNYIMRAI